MTYEVYFSAFNGTNICSMTLASAFPGDVRRYNWRRQDEREALHLGPDDVLLFSMPVYGGFIPQLCVPLAQELLSGEGSPAFILATYGNRAFDNALSQMQELLEKRGFHVLAAGAFVCRHSIFSTVASSRPDADDRAGLEAFARHCASLALRPWDRRLVLPRKDDSDPSTFKGSRFHPDGRGNRCTRCGTCASFCTTGAIDLERPWETDGEKCISCGACIMVCPAKARDYHCDAFMEARAAFEEKCAQRKGNDVFFIDA